MHDHSEQYYTSDWDLGSFNAHKVGVSLKYSPVYGFSNNPRKFNPERSMKFDKAIIRIAKYWRFDRTNTVILKAFIASFSMTYSINNHNPKHKKG